MIELDGKVALLTKFCYKIYGIPQRLEKQSPTVLQLWRHVPCACNALYILFTISQSFAASFINDSGIWLRSVVLSQGQPYQINGAKHSLSAYEILSFELVLLNNPPAHYSPTSWRPLAIDPFFFPPSPTFYPLLIFLPILARPKGPQLVPTRPFSSVLLTTYPDFNPE